MTSPTTDEPKREEAEDKTTTETKTDPAAATLPGTRERPRKTPPLEKKSGGEPPKKRGRPKKVTTTSEEPEASGTTNEEKQEEATAMEPAKAESVSTVKSPKRRGRPKKTATATEEAKSENEPLPEGEQDDEPYPFSPNVDTRLVLSEKRQRTKHSDAIEFSSDTKSGFNDWRIKKRKGKETGARTSPAPKKSGRPKKKASDEDDIDDKPLIETVLGMIERSKHGETTPNDTAEKEIDSAAKEPKKRGRPKKVTTTKVDSAAKEPKKRGRPKKVTITTEEAAGIDLAAKEPKKRGRPPKKAKTATEAKGESALVTDAPHSMEEKADDVQTAAEAGAVEIWIQSAKSNAQRADSNDKISYECFDSKSLGGTGISEITSVEEASCHDEIKMFVWKTQIK